MVRHYSRRLVFKSNFCWSLQYDLAALVSGEATPAFYVSPVNRQIGNAARGQVILLENNPLSLFGGGIYQWRATSSSGNITADSRNAIRISDRIVDAIGEFKLDKAKAFNRISESEYWLLYNGTALVLNYAADAWYRYTNMPFHSMVEIDNELYAFGYYGKLLHVSRDYRDDDNAEIDAFAATGSMDFGEAWSMKYSPMIFVTIQPGNNARLTMLVETNRKSDYPEKHITANLASFKNVDFAHFSFITTRKPHVKRVKMKVKKATFYKLVFKSKSTSATATVLEVDVKLRYAGNVK
jgi:hypothetical protein